METSPIYELLPAFKDRNQVVYLLVGLLSTLDDWTDLLETQAANSRPEYPLFDDPGRDDGLEQEDNPERDDHSRRGFIYFLLGTLSFSGNFVRTLENARRDIPPLAPGVPQAPSWERPSELLR